MSQSAELAELVRRLDALEAQDTVRRLKARYMQWCDEKRGAEIATLFWQDGIWEGRGASTSGAVTGTRAIGEMFEANKLTFTVHYLTNESIQVDGDRATGQWKLFEPCTFDDRVAIWQGGRYVDTFERRDGEWRFTHLVLYLEYRTPYEDGWLRQRVVTL